MKTKKKKNKLEKYISFIQKENNEAIMSFGEFDSQFDVGESHKCQSELGYYFSCQISAIKIGVSDIYTSQTSIQDIGIFSILDEYIILPSKPGNETAFYYKNKIKELFGIECTEETGKNDMINITCNYFNYEDLPDLYFELKSGIGVMALSVDMFKILANYKLEFKLKYKKQGKQELHYNKWILGEPVTKNYNFFVNYTDKEKAYLIIVASSLEGYIFIFVAIIGGFIFLFIFLTIIYCSAKREKIKKKNKIELGNKIGNSRNNFFSIDKNYIHEPILEHEEENENEDKNSNSDSKSSSSSNSNNNDNDNDIITNEKNEDIKSDDLYSLNNDDDFENKNLLINDILIDNNNNKKLEEKDINNNKGNIQKNINNIEVELIANKSEEKDDDK